MTITPRGPFRSAAAALLAGGLLFSGAPAIADTMTQGQQTAPATEIATPAIWEITKPNGAKIWLFGSIHLLPPNLQWRTPAMQAAFDAAEVIVLETNLDDAAGPEMQQHVMQSGMLPAGTTLSSKLGADDLAAFQAAMTSLGMPAQAFDPMQPWLASLTLSVLYAVKQGYDPNQGVDQQIASAGKAAGKEFAYFEDAKEQIDFFATMPEELQLRLFVETVRELNASPTQLNDLVAAWAKGDVAQLEGLMNAAMAAVPELRAIILTNRNAAWVERITGEFMTDSKDYLIVGGAGHFAGNDAVQTLLRAKGVTVVGP